MSDLIDIIIPVFNAQGTIERCLNSILKIKHIKYKVILVDDGSKDNSLNIMKKYCHRYSNVYLFQQNNNGVSVARNNGLRHAHDQWICFIDSDDYIDADNFMRVAKLYLKPNVDLVMTDINYNGKIIGLEKHKNIISDVRQFLLNNYPLYGNELIHVVCNKIYRNKIIKNYHIKFPVNIEVGEDLIFALRYLNVIKGKVVQSRISYYNYYVHSYSATNSFEHNALKSRIMILKDVKKVSTKYHLESKMLLSLVIKAIYSVLLNSLNVSGRKIIYLENVKKDIILKGLGRKLKYSNNLKNDILIFIFKQPSIDVLLFFLYAINIIRKLMFKIKF